MNASMIRQATQRTQSTKLSANILPKPTISTPSLPIQHLNPIPPHRQHSSSSPFISPSTSTSYPAANCPLIPKAHLTAPVSSDTQILRLSDNRLLSYSLYGSPSPTARNILFCHGIPDSRIDACLLPSDHVLALKHNIRWVGIDRPGIGFSTPHEGQTPLTWVEDLKELIGHLGLERYYVFSVSGGTPYALAAAMLLPREEVRGVGIMIGVAPWEAGMKGLSLLNKIGYMIWKYYPGFFRWIFERQIVPIMQQTTTTAAEELMRKQARYMNKEDKEDMEAPGMVEGVARIMIEVYRQGAGGYVEDSMVQTGDWGFRVEDVGYPGVKLWYGSLDVNTPPEMGRWMAERMPGAKLRVFEGRSHFTLWRDVEDVLVDLLEDE